MSSKINLADKLNSFAETWVPKVVGELNGQHVKVVKFEGEYVWHSHEHEDELFLVLAGSIRILLRDGEVVLGPGELYIVPHGVGHALLTNVISETSRRGAIGTYSLPSPGRPFFVPRLRRPCALQVFPQGDRQGKGPKTPTTPTDVVPWEPVRSRPSPDPDPPNC